MVVLKLPLRLRCSRMRVPRVLVRPRPPYFSGVSGPAKPSCPTLAKRLSMRPSSCLSSRSRTGFTSFLAKSDAVLIISCSSLPKSSGVNIRASSPKRKRPPALATSLLGIVPDYGKDPAPVKSKPMEWLWNLDQRLQHVINSDWRSEAADGFFRLMTWFGLDHVLVPFVVVL